MVMSTYLQVLLVVWALCFHPIGFFSLILFFALFTLYQLPPMRLKRLFCGSYRTEGLAAGACVLFGAQRPAEQGWLALTMVLVIGGFSVGSWFKDYKDIDQDRAAGVGTIYTRGMKKGRSIAGIHAFVRVVLAAVLLVPPLWLWFTAGAWLSGGILIVLTAAIVLWLLGLRDRTKGVESSLWVLSGYLAVLAFTVPALS